MRAAVARAHTVSCFHDCSNLSANARAACSVIANNLPRSPFRLPVAQENGGDKPAGVVPCKGAAAADSLFFLLRHGQAHHTGALDATQRHAKEEEAACQCLRG